MAILPEWYGNREKRKCKVMNNLKMMNFIELNFNAKYIKIIIFVFNPQL
jgi:hypothetical protein